MYIDLLRGRTLSTQVLKTEALIVYLSVDQKVEFDQYFFFIFYSVFISILFTLLFK